MSLPPHLEALRDEALRISCDRWAIQKRWKLSKGIDRAWPCPVCGGTDRFSIHTKKNTFNCRRCGISGGGVIDLVIKTENVDFTRACEIGTGRKASDPVDEKRMAEMRARNEADERRRAEDVERYREKARKRAYEIWRSGLSPSWWPASLESAVAAYLRQRGIRLGMGEHETVRGDMIALREDRLPWKEKQGSTWVTLAEGPVMLAAVQRPDGTFGAVHQTWLDPAQPKGKLVLPLDPEGNERPSKKVLGVKKGGAIRLYTPDACRRADAGVVETRIRPRRLVMGEGIETTLTPLAHNFEPDTAYWAGVDLGNMAGKAARSESGGQVYDQPDMQDSDCFVPPDWCEELVFLAEGDSPENHAEEKIIRGLRRALRYRQLRCEINPELPPLAASYVPAPGDGMDLNDLVRVE